MGYGLPMSVFLLTWNPKKWIIAEEEWTRQVELSNLGSMDWNQWSTGNRVRGISPGDFLLLVRVDNNRGIVGSGRAVSIAHKDLHFDEARAKKNNLANYVSIEWESLVEVENRLKIEVLLKEFPEVYWKNLAASGFKVDEKIDEKLVNRWFQHIGLDRPNFPDEVSTYVEGTSTTVSVNRYERNPAARDECIAHFGAKCAVCGFVGQKTYGSKGEDLIHVHHLIELSKVGEEYVVNPIKDLIPVCPNCHAMIHRRKPAFSVAEIKKMLQ
jgi:5-methylcytosine-specific restriction protein A